MLKQINTDVDLPVFLAALVSFSCALETLLNVGFPVDIPARQKKVVDLKAKHRVTQTNVVSTAERAGLHDIGSRDARVAVSTNRRIWRDMKHRCHC